MIQLNDRFILESGHRLAPGRLQLRALNGHRASLLWSRHHPGRHFQQGKVGVLAAHIRVGGSEHAERVVLEQPGMQVIVHVLLWNQRFVSLHRAHEGLAEECGPLIGICR